MKNKKGFTLVELIVVIAILAVILLLIVPNVTTTFNNGKKDAFIRQIQTVWREAEKEFTGDATNDDKHTIYSDANNEIGKTLKLNVTGINYVTGFSKMGLIEYIAIGDKNYCYINDEPENLVIKREDIVEGKLECEGEVCTCGGQSSTVKADDVNNNNTVAGPYVYWDYYDMNYNQLYDDIIACNLDEEHCELASRINEGCEYVGGAIDPVCASEITDYIFQLLPNYFFSSNTYPTSASSSYANKPDVFFRTTVSLGKAVRHEVCSRNGASLICLDNKIYDVNQNNKLENHLLNNGKELFGCQTVTIEDIVERVGLEEGQETITFYEDETGLWIQRYTPYGRAKLLYQLFDTLDYLPRKITVCEARNDRNFYFVGDKGIYGIIKINYMDFSSEEGMNQTDIKACMAYSEANLYGCFSEEMIEDFNTKERAAMEEHLQLLRPEAVPSIY